MNGLNDQSTLDVRKLISGKDGQLYVTTKAGENLFLAEVDEFTVTINPANTDYQPVGSSLVYSVNTGYSLSISFSEALVRDDVMMTEFLEDLQTGYFPTWDFQGKMRRRDGQAQRIVYRNCVPDGEISAQVLKPGEIVKRNWGFRVNAAPELLEHFTYD